MARWLVGGRCVKEKLSEINFYQHQTLSNIKIDQYKQLFNQQKSSQASGDSSDRASEDCLILPASLPASLEQLRQMLLQAARPTSTMCWSLRHIWASSLEGVHAMVSLKSCSDSSFRSGTDVTPFTWTIKTNGFAKKKHSNDPRSGCVQFFGCLRLVCYQGIEWDRLEPKIEKSITRVTSLLSLKLLWGVCLSRSAALLLSLVFFAALLFRQHSRLWLTKQASGWQLIAPLDQLSRSDRSTQPNATKVQTIYILRQNGPLAGRWLMCQREVVQNLLLSTPDPFRHHNRQIQTTFQSTKSSRPARDGSDRASEANKIFAKISTETLTKSSISILTHL